MYLDNDNYKGKIGKVNISSKDNSIRIRFTHLSKRYDFPLSYQIGLLYYKVSTIVSRFI